MKLETFLETAIWQTLVVKYKIMIICRAYSDNLGIFVEILCVVFPEWFSKSVSPCNWNKTACTERRILKQSSLVSQEPNPHDHKYHYVFAYTVYLGSIAVVGFILSKVLTNVSGFEDQFGFRLFNMWLFCVGLIETSPYSCLNLVQGCFTIWFDQLHCCFDYTGRKTKFICDEGYARKDKLLNYVTRTCNFDGTDWQGGETLACLKICPKIGEYFLEVLLYIYTLVVTVPAALFLLFEKEKCC